MNALRIGLSCGLISLLSLAASARTTQTLVWSDEFDGSDLDRSKWNYDTGTGCPDLCGWGNNELQYYRSTNVGVSGGNLVITARRENYGGSEFTSGKITTRGLHSFLYGRIEMRAKLPKGGGMWPAFWMMPADDVYGGWAASGEIDIMESSNQMDYIGGTIHFGGPWPQNVYSGGTLGPTSTDFSEDFHVYALEWEPDTMRWYVDGILYSTKSSSQWYSSAAPENPRAPFDQPFYLILNAAVGGFYTGCTSAACVTANFPQEYVVDYVRVYEQSANVLPDVSIVTPLAGSTVSSGDVLVQADAFDGDGSVVRVEFYLDDTFVRSDTTAPYQWLWPNVVDGCYRIRARAIDDRGGINEAVADITVGSGCGQGAYQGNIAILPGRFEAENYDVGGPLIAYEDFDVANQGSAYRIDEQVDIESCSDVGGGFNVGWVRTGEWIEYSVFSTQTTDYAFRARVSSALSGGSFRLDVDGLDRTGVVVVPATGNWQSWVDVDFNANLGFGARVLRFVPLSGEFNLNWIEASLATTSVTPATDRGTIQDFTTHPNPFNPKTSIRFTLGRSAAVDLVVYSAAGRVVRTIAGGELLAAGSHERAWDARDDAGASVSGGVYFARLSTGEAAKTLRLVLLK